MKRYDVDRSFVNLQTYIIDQTKEDEVEWIVADCKTQCMEMNLWQLYKSLASTEVIVALNSVENFICKNVTLVLINNTNKVNEDYFEVLASDTMSRYYAEEGSCYYRLGAMMNEIQRLNLQKQMESQAPFSFYGQNPYELDETEEPQFFDTDLGITLNGLPKNAEIYLRFNDKQVSEAGLSQNLRESRHFKAHQKLDVMLGIIKYTNFETIVQGFTDPMTDSFFSNSLGNYVSTIDGEIDSTARIAFTANPKLLIYTRYPSQFLSALVKIGGLLGLLKVMFLFSFYHRRLFEQKVLKKLDTQRSENFDNVPLVESVLLQKHLNYTDHCDTQGSMLMQQERKNEVNGAKFEELFTFENFMKIMQNNQRLQQRMNEMERRHELQIEQLAKQIKQKC
ncbi:hypothetical protein FGO68_gene16715 [Halteria grandinella]|uniref:Uncharacterized protein n=1 Tax=Halteria grandinella TaxID=5974 RepID=A0A8J8NR05_HALGN|nr:hypothetical protein FGO68_gene16715 [Halteria grandinella]